MYNDFEGDIGDNDDDASYSYGQSSSTTSASSRGLLRRKGGFRRSSGTLDRDMKSEMSSDLEKTYGVKTAPAVARAMDMLDTWAQLTGR